MDFTDYIPEMMAEWGYDVEILVLDSPVVANTALVEGSVDANYIQHLPYAWHNSHQTGDIVSRISYDIDTVNASLSNDLLQIAASARSTLNSRQSERASSLSIS